MSEYFEIDRPSPYMLLVAPVTESRKIPMTDEQERLFGIDKLNVSRSDIPAVTHIDYSARIQTVSRDTNPLYYDVIQAFYQKTRMPGHHQHVVQRPRRADRLPAGGGVQVLHAYGNGLPGHGEFHPRKEGPGTIRKRR